MVNFRFHLVSLTAVFLALAAGITIGAGVVDRATVDQIERQLSDVAERRRATNAENDRLQEELARWVAFSEAAGDQLVAGELAAAPVVLVASAGLDRGVIDALRGTLSAAGAQVDGTLWITSRWSLDDADEAQQLASVLDAAPTTQPDDLRAAAIAGVTAAWAIGDSGPLVASLVETGFLEYEAPAEEAVVLEQLPRADTLFVVISGDAADVAPADVAVPLVTRLAGAEVRVLAAEPTRPPPPAPEGGGEPEEPPPGFVAQLRDVSLVAARISTVDNLDDYRGRLAAVLALRDLRVGTTGHYGVGPDTRLVPELPAA